MTRQDWLISIDDTVSTLIAADLDDTVRFALGKYGAESADELNPADLPDVYNELDAIVANLN